MHWCQHEQREWSAIHASSYSTTTSTWLGLLRLISLHRFFGVTRKELPEAAKTCPACPLPAGRLSKPSLCSGLRQIPYLSLAETKGYSHGNCPRLNRYSSRLLHWGARFRAYYSGELVSGKQDMASGVIPYIAMHISNKISLILSIPSSSASQYGLSLCDTNGHKGHSNSAIY